MLAGHGRVVGALGGLVAEVAVPVDHLLRRPPADAELEPATGDQVGRAGVLGHVERVLVAHVDDAGADLDPAGPGPDGGEQRERRGQLAGEVVHPEVRAVGPELLGRDRELDGLQQRVGGRARLRLRRRRPVPERQEADLLQFTSNDSEGRMAKLPRSTVAVLEPRPCCFRSGSETPSMIKVVRCLGSRLAPAGRLLAGADPRLVVRFDRSWASYSPDRLLSGMRSERLA